MFVSVTRFKSSERGYTLIDLAIAMVILGVLLSGIAAGARIYMKDREASETRERAQMIARAIDNFVLENGRFPCPGAIDITVDNTKYGAETSCSTRRGFDSSGNLASAVTPGNFGGGLYIEESEKSSIKYVARGMVPFAALNIPEFYAYDGYGNRFNYVVTVDQTDRDTFLDSGGGITVVDSRSVSDTDQTKSNHFLLFSSGASEEGAWSRYGAQVKPCGSGLDSQNCNTGTSGTAKQAIYSAARYSTADGANKFDDFVLNKTSMHLPLWRVEDNTGADIRTIDDGKRVIVQEDGYTIDADPSSAAAEMRMDVAGGTRVERAISPDYCLHSDGSACFDTPLLLDNARGELNCADPTVVGRDSQGNYMYGIERSLANCRTTMTWLCPEGQYARGILSNGLPDCQTYYASVGTPPTLIIGNCGTANNTSRLTAPSTSAELCSAGTASTVSGTGPWTWSCAGENGGLNVDCEAYLGTPPTSATCGTAHGTVVSSAPTTNLCAAGTASAVSGSNPYTWSCTSGATVENCATASPTTVNGSCGTSNGGNFASAPSGDLCTTGTASAVSGTGPWTWSCAGTGTPAGTTASCSANKTVNGACGTANGVFAASAPSSNLCTAGTASAVGGSNPYTWTCAGVYGGSTASCSSGAATTVNGSCGSANGVVVASAPSSNLCTTGTASSVTGSNPYSWTCAGTGTPTGTTASCASGAPTTVNGSCGSANGANYYSTPSSNLCTSGSSSAVSGTGPWTWSCAGSGTPTGTTASCSANKAVNGTCGTSNGSNSYTAPSTNLCSAGSTSAVSGTGPWTWSCTGSNGGATASCSASKSVDGVCGSADGVAVTSAPSTNLCSVGSASSVSGTGPWAWSCAGSNGGTTASCSAPVHSGGGAGCFTGSTTVLMADGSRKPVVDLKLGDKIRGKTQVNTVTAVAPFYVKSHLYRLNGSKDAFFTANHPFYTKEGVWKAIDVALARKEHPGMDIQEMKVGDVLVDESGKEVPIESLESEDHGWITVYNPSLDGDNTYYANGFLVHNITEKQ